MKAKRAGGVAQVVEHLSSNCKALSSNSSTIQKKYVFNLYICVCVCVCVTSAIIMWFCDLSHRNREEIHFNPENHDSEKHSKTYFSDNPICKL
jgi:hypothetical protein